MTPWQVCDYENRRILSFGITEAIFGFALSEALGGGALATIGADAIGGSLGGAALGGITGGGKGALLGAAGGALTGGAAGAAGAFGPELASATGLPAAGIEAGIGGLGGVAGSLATGSNPLLGAGVGALGGVGAGLSAPAGSATPAAAPTGSPMPSGGASAAGIAGGDAMSAGPLLDATGGEARLGAIGDAGSAGAGNIGGSNISEDLSSGAPTSSHGGPIGGMNDYAATPGDFSSGDGISSFISKHWPMLASAGILGVEGLTKNQTYPAETALQKSATTAHGQAEALMAPIQTGVLPPGAQQAVDASAAASKAGVASTYGNLGLAGSTMQDQANQAIERNKAAQTFGIANELLAKGVDLSRLSAGELTTLLESQMREDQAFNQGLTSFASGLAGARLAA